MFHRILPIIIGLLVVLDGFILLGFGEYGPLTSLSTSSPIFASILIIIQFPILYTVLYKAYIEPVQLLTKDIARFMTGIQDEPEMKPNAWSNGMNQVIIFFIKSLQILKVFKQELRDGRKLRSEVEIASEIQKKTLDQQNIIVPNLTISMGTTPASEVGGDSLDIIPGGDNNFYIYIGDVTGHGVPSGFVMMMVNALISAFSLSESNGAIILAKTNTILRPRIKQNMMMTCVMLRWDANTKKMYYTGAGHEFVLIYKTKENKVYKVKSGGVALGMVKDSTKILKEQQISFEPGDVIILYTDGISEARYRSEQNGILFSVDRIIESIIKLDVKTSENIFRKLTIDLSAWMGYQCKQYDDISLAVVEYNSDPDGAAQTILDISTHIDVSNITEWNWGLEKIKNPAK
ncbi:serine/threonine-protein phosphatase [Candidatus Gracilibacteria bacterium]|nr:serine/threonine-protein phosphatase [Candidatus Gracilibacteria bacterium]